jgi:uncharacterized protein (DUF1810 family)
LLFKSDRTVTAARGREEQLAWVHGRLLMKDDFHLQRFLDAQDPVYDDALAMLRGGAMCTSFMDFIFPRLALTGAGDSGCFAIASLDEARAYLAFPVLGNRYRECVEALTWLAGESAADVFGETDAHKLQSSLTLFSEASGEVLLRTMLTIWFDSLVDEATMSRLDLVA